MCCINEVLCHECIQRSGCTNPLDIGEWSDSCSGRFMPKGKTPGAHVVRGWVDLRTSLDGVEKKQIFCLCQAWNPNSSTFQSIAHQYMDRAIPANYTDVYKQSRLVRKC
jgi:hypothetical protein